MDFTWWVDTNSIWRGLVSWSSVSMRQPADPSNWASCAWKFQKNLQHWLKGKSTGYSKSAWSQTCKKNMWKPWKSIVYSGKTVPSSIPTHWILDSFPYPEKPPMRRGCRVSWPWLVLQGSLRRQENRSHRAVEKTWDLGMTETIRMATQHLNTTWF